MKKWKIFSAAGLIAVSIISGVAYNNIPKVCDGVDITSNCIDESGTLYSKYIFHAAEAEKTEKKYHAATPEKSHQEYHAPVYGTKTVKECIKTTISYKSGSCAKSRCRDGEYSGSSGRGTCSYHGGVLYSGGPWYTYREEEYLITPGYYEKVVDEPAKEAWTETVVISPAKEAYYEKVVAES